MKLSFTYLALLAVVLCIVAACSKSTPASTTTTTTTTTTTPTPVTVPTGPINNTPLPNTVDKTDTLKVVAYNVLNFGDGCQGTLPVMDAYLKTIIQYANPDLFSVEKMYVNLTPLGSTTFSDEINNNVLNAAYPGKYAYCTATNAANDNSISVLFYNKQKLSYVYTKTLVVNVSDFNLYKLYYNDPNLAITHDTTFLYVVVNHTQSGSAPTPVRDAQESAEMAALRSKFGYLPNLINMGDFNQHNSSEAGYQSIIATSDTANVMSDPPFNPDKTYSYPADWDNNPVPFAKALTTSTRALSNVPNTCGTNGGAKSWYDHIFISPWLIRGSNYMTYIPNSFKSIGNDGNRVGVDINSTTPVANTSVPPAVLNALFQFSNKYPVTIQLLVKANRSGHSYADPAERN
jgi:hypothetical protein